MSKVIKEKLIKTRKRVKDFGEVFTPSFIVKDMCDLVSEQCKSYNTTFLEPTCGTGNFLVEILKRKLEQISTENLDSITKLGHFYIALSSIYGCDIQMDNVVQCRNRLSVLFSGLAREAGLLVDPKIIEMILNTNIRCADILKDAICFCIGDFISVDGEYKLELSFSYLYEQLTRGLTLATMTYELKASID